MRVDVYNQKGEKTGSTELPKETFGLSWSPNLIHQVMVAMQANKRKNTAYAKDRSEVSGGGKKPWRQKGTGRARHGSIRSPIWRGGGVTFGPSNERNYNQKINKKMGKKALFVALSQKARDKEILILDNIEFKNPKTKEAVEVLKNLSKIKGFEKISGKKNSVIILIKEKNDDIKRAFRNLSGVFLNEARNLNLLNILTYKYIIFLKESINFFKKV